MKDSLRASTTNPLFKVSEVLPFLLYSLSCLTLPAPLTLSGNSLLLNLSDSIDIDLLHQGLNDFFKNNDLLIENQDCLPIIQEYISKIQIAKQELGKNKLNEWLADSTKIIEAKITSSGLKYEIITTGAGNKPTENDNVSVHYYGSLTDGTKFDSSFDRGEPASFPVSGVISGWTEALLLMNVGSKWKLTIPANLAYGEKGAGAIIAPNSDLIFIVELLKIN